VPSPFSLANTMSVMLGRGDGSFGAPQSFATCADPFTVSVGDFNEDGWPDAAVADNSNPGAVVVLLNDGMWGPPAPPALPPRGGRGERPVPLAEKNAHRAAKPDGHGQVGPAVPVEVSGHGISRVGP
jgi:hypothetical protein